MTTPDPYLCTHSQVVTGRKGRQGVTFAADGATVSWTLPTLTINGVIYGARSMEYAGQIDFVDAQNGLRATLVFDSDTVKVRNSAFDLRNSISIMRRWHICKSWYDLQTRLLQ